MSESESAYVPLQYSQFHLKHISVGFLSCNDLIKLTVV